jgi:site-specific recombinase XerD
MRSAMDAFLEWDNGVNEKVIQMEIGHSSLRMMQRYTHFSPKSRRATAEKLAI